MGRPLAECFPLAEPSEITAFLRGVFQKSPNCRELRLTWSSEGNSQPAIMAAGGLVAGTRPLLAVLRLRLPKPSDPENVNVEFDQEKLLALLKTAVFRLDEAGRIGYINDAWEEFSGFPACESLDKSLLEFIDHDDAPAFVEEFERLVLGERAVMRQDLRLMRANGGV
ncbi:MAG: PAS domain-containing protein, partial [Bryobacterales bacterium]|nr:PAS domain-containing protein [Bryobacterales bacterium]